MTVTTLRTANTTASADTQIIDKVRAGRRAALATLRAARADGANVVSMFEGRMPPRRAVPEFHTVRHQMPVLVLTERVAA